MTEAKKWEYEFIFVLPPSLEKQASLVKSLKEVISKMGGKIVKETDWGQKDFAYPIKKQFRGQYFIWQITFSQSPNLEEAGLVFNRESNILRYLWIKV